MYKNIYVENRFSDSPDVHIWDSEEGHIQFEYDKKMYIRSERGEYESLYGDPVAEVSASKVDYNTKQQLKNQYGEGRAIFQSDLRVETQVLSEIYRDEDEPSDDVETLFFDIEVSMEGELPNVDTANNPITSIAYNNTSTDDTEIVILDEDDELEAFEHNDVNIIPFDDEDEMLFYFVEKWRDIDPDIISGWNCDGFDVPYLYRRITRVINGDVADRLSPIGEVDFRENRGPRGNGRFIIAGVSSLDYLDLYKNFTFSEENSYSLDAISSKELDRGKVEYEGKEVETEDGETVVIQDLDDLKEYDIETFVKYNAEDVWLVRDMDRKLDFIGLARKIAHMGHVPYEDIYMSSRYIDGAFVTRLNKKGVIAPNVRRITDFELDGYHAPGEKRISLKSDIHPDVPKKGTLGIDVSTATTKEVEYEKVEGNHFVLEEPTDFEILEEYNIKLRFEGAYVKEPDPGLYEWIFDLDLTSMYPSIIMSLNISPETLVGKIYGWDAEEFLKEDKTYDVWIFEEESFAEFSKSELEKFLDKGNYSVGANGAFYRNDKRGIVPEVLEDWFTLRQSYKSERDKWRERDNDEKAEYYDKLQHVHKILINCFTPDHDIITKDGIKNIEDVEVGEEVYSINQDTGEIEFKEVTRTYRQDHYEGEIVDIDNTFVDFNVTSNHNMVFEDNGDIFEMEAEGMFNSKKRFRPPSGKSLTSDKDERCYISLKEECERLDIDYKYDEKNDKIKNPRRQSHWVENTYSMVDFLRFCGWYISEGWTNIPKERVEYENTTRGKSRIVGISNYTLEEQEQIRDLFDRMNIVYTEHKGDFVIGNDLFHFIMKKDFGRTSHDKKIPEWVWNLSGEKLKNLLETAYLGDGNKSGFRYNTASEELAEDFVQLAYHCGYRARIRNDESDPDCWRISYYDRSRGVSPVIKHDQREKKEYEGPIVCIEVEDNHTVLAGRNGKFNWTGQSVYGVLGLPTFRFYSLYNSKCVTLTGQSLIKYTQKMGDHYYNRKIGKEVEFEDNSEMSIDLYDTYKVKRAGEIREIKGKKLQVGDEIVIDE